MDCVGKVTEYAKKQGREFSKSKLKEMGDRLDQIVNNSKDTLTPAQINSELQKLVDAEVTKYANARKVARLMELETRAKARSIILEESVKENGKTYRDRVDNLLDYVTGGGNKAGRGMNMSPQNMARSLEADMLGDLNFAVQEHLAELEHGVSDLSLLKDIGAAQSGGELSNTFTAKVARQFVELQNRIVDLKRSYDPYFEPISDYFIKQDHSQQKVSAVSFEEWAIDAMDAFGKKSFTDLTPEKKLERLQAIYKAVVDGTYGTQLVKEPGNIQYRMARERSLIPNDAEAFFNYHQKYGEGTVYDVMLKTIRQGSKDVATLSKFGAEPQDFIDRLIKDVMNGADTKLQEKFLSNKSLLDASFKQAMGFANAPAKTPSARFTANMLAYNVIAKLQGVYFALTDDIARSMAITQSASGQNPVSNLAELAHGYVKNFVSKENAREVAPLIWMVLDDHQASLVQDLGSSPGRDPGILAKWARITNKINMLSAHDRASRMSTGVFMSRLLAKMAENDFASLPSYQQQMLKRYNIDAPKWELARKAIEKPMNPVDRPYPTDMVTSEGVKNIPDEAISAYMSALDEKANPTKESIGRARNELSMALGTIINDHADIGSSRAGIAELAKLYRGKDINDPVGQALRLWLQFKTASLKNMNTTARLYYSGNDPMKANFSGIAKLMTYGVIAYTLRQWAINASQGKTIEDPRTPAFITGALSSAVAGGPLVDMVAHAAMTSGEKSTADALKEGFLGPNYSMLWEGVGAGIDTAQAIGGNEKKQKTAPSEVAKFVVKHQPLPTKWPIVKSVADFYIWNELREAAQPGYKRNLEKHTTDTPALRGGEQSYWMGNPNN